MAAMLGSLIPLSPLHAESGLSEAKPKRSFWVVPPFALERDVANSKDVTLFAGCQSDWYDLWSVSDIEHIGWDDWDVKNVKVFGVHGSSLIFGGTQDGRWFIANTRGGRLPWFYDDEAAWSRAVVSLGGDPQVRLTFDQGYEASQIARWKWRILTPTIIAVIVSLPWVLILVRCRRKWKKRATEQCEL